LTGPGTFRWGVALASLLGCSSATDPAPATNLTQFASQLEDYRSSAHIAGMSAAIASGGRVIWARGFGYANVERHTAPADSTEYHFASLTKTFASTVIMQLVEQGKVNLEDSVSKYGINLAGPGVIRVKHLMTHTSEGTPGAQFLYNGNRFALLDQVIFRASGETFGQQVTAAILLPLHLPHTAPNVADPVNFSLAGLDRDRFLANLATGYTPDGSKPVAYESGFSTAAGLIGSAVDMARYSIAIDSGKFLSTESWKKVFTPAVSSTTGAVLPYGLGWFVTPLRGIDIQWHYGLWTAASALVIRAPGRNLTFVILANTDGLTAPARLGSGDLLSSAAARLFLNAFVFGNGQLN
jgi:CubicO group peptidase (beta-lactamase class C family)